MKRRFLIHLALLLLAAMLLPTPVMAVDLTSVTAGEEAFAVEIAPEELPEFELTAPESDSVDAAVEAAVMAAPASADTAKSASVDVPKSAPKKLTLGVKEKYTLKITGAKKYETSDKTIVTVTKKGVITAKKVGKATITATDKYGKKTKIKVTVKKAPDTVTLSKAKATLKVGKALQLKAKLPTGTASNKQTWTSNNKKVAKVDATGKVTAVKVGKAEITVKTFNKMKATCTITVKAVKNNPASDCIDLSVFYLKSIDDANDRIGDDLKYIDKVWYTGDDGKKHYFYDNTWHSVYQNDYCEVYTDIEKNITRLELTNSSGKYSVFGVTTGMPLNEAISVMNAHNWKDRSDYIYFIDQRGFLDFTNQNFWNKHSDYFEQFYGISPEELYDINADVYIVFDPTDKNKSVSSIIISIGGGE